MIQPSSSYLVNTKQTPLTNKRFLLTKNRTNSEENLVNKIRNDNIKLKYFHSPTNIPIFVTHKDKLTEKAIEILSKKGAEINSHRKLREQQKEDEKDKFVAIGRGHNEQTIQYMVNQRRKIRSKKNENKKSKGSMFITELWDNKLYNDVLKASSFKKLFQEIDQQARVSLNTRIEALNEHFAKKFNKLQSTPMIEGDFPVLFLTENSSSDEHLRQNLETHEKIFSPISTRHSSSTVRFIQSPISPQMFFNSNTRLEEKQKSQFIPEKTVPNSPIIPRLKLSEINDDYKFATSVSLRKRNDFTLNSSKRKLTPKTDRSNEKKFTENILTESRGDDYGNDSPTLKKLKPRKTEKGSDLMIYHRSINNIIENCQDLHKEDERIRKIITMNQNKFFGNREKFKKHKVEQRKEEEIAFEIKKILTKRPKRLEFN